MRFVETPLAGAFVIELELVEDPRGFFARAFCADEFRRRGLEPCIAQSNISHNKRKGTLRGMHYQVAPHQEAKLVRCIRGAIYDVIVDLRPESPSYCRWTAVELTADNRRALYVPQDVAHGFQTLADDTEVFYEMSAPHVAAAARGVRWNDPRFGIAWPLPEPLLSERDAAYADFSAPSRSVEYCK